MHILSRVMGYRFSLPLFLILLSAPRFLSQAANTTQVSPEAEKIIKERVTEYYNDIKSNDLKKAAELVLPKSRKRFLTQKRDPVDAFRIIVVKMEEGGTSAAVEASISIGGTPSFPYQMEVPNYTRWRFVKGNWYCDIENPPQSLAQKMEEYSKTPQSAPGPLLGLSAGAAVKFDQDHLKLGMVPIGPPITLKFPFTNLSSQPIKVENIYLRADFLKNKTEKGMINPHEKGEVIVELDTSKLKGHIDHSFVVEFLPIKEMIQLYFKAFILPADQIPPVSTKPPAEGTKK